jgi:SnoaL-like domain
VCTDVCVLDYGEIDTWNGVDAVAEFMDQSHAMAGHQHLLSDHAIALGGDTATARTYIDGLIMAQDNNSGVNAIGFYDDELVHTTAGWQIARRKFTPVRVVAV